MSPTPLYLAIDIGTSSVRAALFTSNGKELHYTSKGISTRRPQPGYHEQSTQDIWRSTTQCIRTLTSKINNESEFIASIGVDATCSLAICKDDENLSPIAITPSNHNGEDEDVVYNVILWLDKRAVEETDFINSQSETNPSIRKALSHFGGKINSENQPPKLKWLFNHRPHILQQNPLFFDLSDWLVAALTGQNNIPRSVCTVTCKWGWNDNSWDASFWTSLGLQSLSDNNFYSIGTKIVPPGTRVSSSISRTTLHDCNFYNGNIIVSAPLIDAYSGSVWSFAVEGVKEKNVISFVCGTSTCMLQVRNDEVFVKGIWGPYKDALIRDKYVAEGGQSTTGKLLEHIIRTHPVYSELMNTHNGNEGAIYNYLSERGKQLMKENNNCDPATHVHCLDHHAGNRSPLGVATLRGVWVGLSLERDKDDLVTKFRAAMQALCYGARRIVEAMNNGTQLDMITACGGICQNEVFLQELADCLGVKIVLPADEQENTVLLGSAVLARMAHEDCEDVVQIAGMMCRLGNVVEPNETRKNYHDKKYKVYRKISDDSEIYRQMMSE